MTNAAFDLKTAYIQWLFDLFKKEENDESQREQRRESQHMSIIDMEKSAFRQFEQSERDEKEKEIMKAYLIRRLGRMAEDSGIKDKIERTVKSNENTQLAMQSYLRYLN